MLLLILLFFLCLLFTCYIIHDKLSRIIILVYLIWWSVWLSLSCLNLYDLYKVSDETYALLLLGVLLFFIGYITASNTKKHTIRKAHIVNVVDHKAFYFFSCAALCVLFFYWYRYMSILEISPNIRMERYSTTYVFKRAAELLLYNYLIEPFISIAIIVIAYMIIRRQFVSSKFVVLFLCVFFYATFGMARGPFLSIGVSMVILFFVCNLENKEKNNVLPCLTAAKSKTLPLGFIIVAGGVLVIIAVFTTAYRYGMREISVQSLMTGAYYFFENFIIYFTGPFRALEHGIQVYPAQTGWLFGRGTFAGIDELIYYSLMVIGFPLKTYGNGIIGNLLQGTILTIGENRYFNFAYTNLMVFYFDFGVPGVAIFSFLFGNILRRTVYLYQRNKSMPTMVLFVYFTHAAILSVFSWQLQSPASVLLLTVCYGWHRLTRNNIA